MFADTEPIIRKYTVDCQKAWDSKNEKLALTYYDSINTCITGSYIGNHKFKTLNNKVIDMGKIIKPTLIIVSASWCEPCRAEIPALNKIVEKYKDKIDFVVLFWNDKKETQKLAPLYNKSIFIVPSDVQSKDDVHKISIGGFNHIMGYPTNYMINASRKIVKYATGAAVATSFVGPDGKMVTITEDQALEKNYTRLKDDVDFLIANNKE